MSVLDAVDGGIHSRRSAEFSVLLLIQRPKRTHCGKCQLAPRSHSMQFAQDPSASCMMRPHGDASGFHIVLEKSWRTRDLQTKRSTKLLKSLALPRGIEPLFQP